MKSLAAPSGVSSNPLDSMIVMLDPTTSYKPSAEKVAQDIALFEKLSATPRSQDMTTAVREAVESRAEDQVIITMSGIAHTFDYFNALGARPDSVYLNPKHSEVNSNSDFVQFAKKVATLPEADRNGFFNLIAGLVNMAVTAHGTKFKNLFSDLINANPKAFDNFYLEYQNTAINIWTLENIRNPGGLQSVEATNPRVFHIGEAHFMPSTKFLEGLPSRESLRANGIQEVVLLMEGPSPEAKLSTAYIKKFTKIKSDAAFNSLPGQNRKKLKRAMARDHIKRSGAPAALKKGVVINPILHGLMNVLEAYSSFGIKVTIRGIDTRDTQQTLDLLNGAAKN